MANKYWWEEYENKDQGEQKQKSYWWDDGSAAESLGNSISSRVSTWLENHNNYVRNYQTRNSGRKYSYEDSYVSDSGSWLDTVTKQKSAFDAEADSILELLEQNKGYFNDEWVKSVQDTLAGARADQSDILDRYTNDHNYWMTFNPNEEQAAAGYTAPQIYKEWQAESKQYADDLAFDVNAGLRELEGLKQSKSTYLAERAEAQKKAQDEESIWESIGRWLGTTPDTTIPLSGANSGSTAKVDTEEQEYDRKIAELEERINRSKYIQGYEGYMDNMDARDYAVNSKYASTRTGVPIEDAYWGLGGQYIDEGKLFGDITYDYINRNADALSIRGSNDVQTNAYFSGADEGFLQTMTDEEIGVYNYLYKTKGKEAANEFVGFIASDLEGRRRLQENAKWAAYAKENPVGSSVFSTLISPLKGMSYLGQAADMLDDGAMDENAGYNRFSDIPSAIRTQVSTTIENSGKWGKVGSFAYNTGMSMADFLLTTGVSGGNQALSLAIMGTGAAADATIAAKKRGLDDDQAFTLGTIAGLAEVAMEKVSLGAWLDGDMTEGALRYVLKNALSEGAEEAGTSITNLLADILVAGDKSEWSVAMRAYIDSGKTPAQAFGLVAAETAAQIGLDALGGMLSGAAIGGGTYAATSVGSQFQYGDIGKDKELSQALVTESLELTPDSQYAQKMQGKLNSDKSLSGMQVRNLIKANDAQIAVENYNEALPKATEKLKALGETKNVQKIADLVAKRVSGQELTRKEISTLARSDYGAKVAKEMTETTQRIKATREYKAVTQRTEPKYNVSESGEAVVQETGETFDITKAEVVQVGNGQVTFKTGDGKEIAADSIDFANDDQSLLVSSVAEIENITPAAANAIMADVVDMSKPVGVQLNGIDEAYTYGFHGYSVEDMKAGHFTGNLSETQMMSAYELGKAAKGNVIQAQESRRVLRTAKDAKVEAAQQKAKFEGEADVYFLSKEDGSVSKFDGKTDLEDKKAAPVRAAQILSKLGLGGSGYFFFESYKNEAGELVFKDDKGVEREAPNGIYRLEDGRIFIDLNAGNDGRGVGLFTLAHELTHFIKHRSEKQFNALAELVKEAYDKTEYSLHERVLLKQEVLNDLRRQRAEKNGEPYEPVSYSYAYEDVICDALSTMLSDGSFFEKVAEIKVKDKGLFNNIKRFFEKFFAKFKKVYEKLTPDQKDAQDIREMKGLFDQLQQAFAEALVEASDNYRSITQAEAETLQEAGIGFDEETKSVYSVRFSTAYKDTIQVGKKEFDAEAIAQIVAKGTGRDIVDARKWVKAEMTLANIILANPEFLDFEADSRYEAIKKNSDYPQGTVDLSNLCPKREEFTAMFDRLQKSYPDKLFTAQDIADMRKILAKNDITVACGACFVEDRRQLTGEIADTFIGMWKEAVETGKPLMKTNASGVKSELLVTKALAKQYGLTAGAKIMAEDTYIPNQYDLTTYEGFKVLEKNHPTIAMAFNRYNNSRGQQSARLIEGRAEYNRQILGWSPAKVRSVNNNGGLRIFSFSDFEVVHLLDLVQVIIDCAAMGVKIQGYTKVPAFAKLVRNTGIKLNRSLIPLGDYGFHMEDGKVVLDYDPTEGVDIKDKNFLDESDNPNVGNIVIGINETQIGAAMVDPFIDYIIPFHSNKAKAILEKLGTGKWVNYKESQHEKDIATGSASKKNVNIYTEVINKYHPKNKVEFVEAFLAECKRQGKIPRYAEFLNKDANGDYVYREGYHKLLVDFKMFDKDGNILPQGDITPNLDEDFMKDLLNAEVQKKQDYKFPQEVYDDIDKQFGEKYSYRGLNKDGIEVYETSEETKKLSYTERQKQFLDTMKNEYQGRTAKFIRNGHAYYATFEEKDINKNIYGDKLSDKKGWKAKINAGADGDIFELVENAKYNGSLPEKGKKNTAHQGVGYWDYFIKNVQIDGTVFDLVANVRKKADGAFVYSIQLKENKKIKASPPRGLLLKALSGVTNASGDRVTHSGAKVNRGGEKLSERIAAQDYVSYDRRAILKESKVDEYLADYAAKSSPKYAQAYIAYVRPRTFLKLTTDDMYERQRIAEQAGELDEEKLTSSRPGIYLRIDHETGQVTGHEGRHRMSAMENAGVELVPVLLLDTSNKMTKTDIAEITLHGQFDELEMGIVRDLIPLNYENRDRVIKNFATQTNLQRIGEKYGHNKTLRFSERTGESVSNRHLLANAFESMSQNSIEYGMIHRYKAQIEKLNHAEEQLSELNAQIRKMRFGDGERDAKKLKELENKAKELAKEINKQDKILLGMEASEPLRKVIEQERKKEAQKTRERVEQIHKNRKLSKEQTELRHKIRKAVRDLDKILNRGNKQRNVKEDIQPVVTKALKAADILFTDNYGSYDMLRNGIGADMSDAEEALVKTCAEMLKAIDEMPGGTLDAVEARKKAEDKLRAKMSKLKDVFARERKRLNNTTVSAVLGDLADAYKSLENSEQGYVQGVYMEAVYNFLKYTQEQVGGTIVSDMNKDQLEALYTAYKMVLATVQAANKMFNQELKLSREELANAVIGEVIEKGGKHGLWTPGEIKASQFSWNNMKPVWVADRIGSDTFGKLMRGLFQGQYNFAVDIEEAKRFKQSMDEKYHPRSWDMEKTYDFESSTGTKFQLNLQQIMSLYAFSKRDQAHSHLLNGGFVFEGNSTVVVDENGRKKTYIHNDATSYKLNEVNLQEIIGTLSDEQIAYVDEMQKYLSDVMGAKGNEVSMKLYGIAMFKEKNYFPLRSSGAYMERAKEAELKKQQGQINLVNSGFTHAVKPQAKNPIILSGFMDVWAEHCNEMSMYHSMVLPMEDFRKVYNFTTVHDGKMDSASVFQTIQDAYGKAATDYIDQLYRELNAGATVDPRETPFKARISKFKKAAVMLSASVVVQQFSSVGRAYALIDPKHFIGRKVQSTDLSAVDEMKKYAPVAIIKEMGGFDTGTKGSAKSYIMAETYGKGERLEGLKKDEQYRSDLMGLLPAKADEKTWCAIWEAVKRETLAKHPKMDATSEEFLKLAGERFSEVIEKTQVYDSVLARSANMRSKSAFMAMATAFMAEPTTTINLLENAIRSGDKKQIAKSFGAVATAIVLNNALASIVYAMRDDDEDETYLEKYFQSMASGMIDDIIPMSYYPFLKDVYSLFQGYDVERADMSVIADVRDALKRAVSVIGKDTSGMDDDQLAEHWKNVNGVLMSLLDAGFSMFGVPVKNVRRDASGIINAYTTLEKDLTERDTTWMSFWDKVGAAVKDTIPVLAWTKDKAKGDKLYDAIMSGDQQYLARLKSGYKTDSAYQSAVRKALRENDSRIHEAAQARYNGDIAECTRIYREIKAEGKFDPNDIMEAIYSEESKIRDEQTTDKVTSEHSSTDFVNAVIYGETTLAESMREEIISTNVANGKTQAEAEEAFVDSVKTGIKNAFAGKLLTEAGAKEMLTEYADMSEEDAAQKVSYWAFVNAHQEYKDVLNESNVTKYHEHAEPAGISLDVYVQYITGTSGIKTIYDEWGDTEKSAREQVLEVIDSLPLTWQQKDALYLAHGYAESKIWDVPW